MAIFITTDLVVKTVVVAVVVDFRASVDEMVCVAVLVVCIAVVVDRSSCPFSLIGKIIATMPPTSNITNSTKKMTFKNIYQVVLISTHLSLIGNILRFEVSLHIL